MRGLLWLSPQVIAFSWVSECSQICQGDNLVWNPYTAGRRLSHPPRLHSRWFTWNGRGTGRNERGERLERWIEPNGARSPKFCCCLPYCALYDMSLETWTHTRTDFQTIWFFHVCIYAGLLDCIGSNSSSTSYLRLMYVYKIITIVALFTTSNCMNIYTYVL